MKNKLRAGMGIKNPMVMVDPDKAKEKFEKMATSITASTGEEEEKEGACESASVAQALEALKEADVQGKFMPSNPQFKGVGANKKFKPETSGTTSYNAINPSTNTIMKGGAYSSQFGKDNPIGTSETDRARMGQEQKKKIANMTSSYDPLSNKGVLEVSEKILKKNFNLGEEGYDIARDMGRVKPSKDKKDATSYPPTEEMKKTQKVNKGPSALEIVKKKYGKAVMDVDKKKKDKK